MSEKRELERERRRQILDAAQKVFSEHGLDQARMDDIVAESGLSKGALYWYYKSKDALIHALLDRLFGGELKRAEELVNADGSAVERMKAFLALLVGEIRRFEPLMPLAYEYFSLAARSKPARRHLTSYYRRYIGLLAELISQGIEAGEFSDADPQAAALAVGGMFEGITLFWFLDPGSVDWDQMEVVGLSLLLDGLRRRES